MMVSDMELSLFPFIHTDVHILNLSCFRFDFGMTEGSDI